MPNKTINKIDIPSLDDFMSAGSHFGHKTSKRCPKMGEYILSHKNGIHVIDLEKTSKKLEEALTFLRGVALGGDLILFVGVKPASKELIKKIAKSCDMPYVTERWLGGTLSNFKVISGRLKRLEDLKRKKHEGDWEKYTKKERAGLEKELAKLELRFGGLEKMKRLPGAVFFFSINSNKIAVAEATKMGIKTVAISDTNANPKLVDYPIPANDDALSSLQLIGECVANAVKL